MFGRQSNQMKLYAIVGRPLTNRLTNEIQFENEQWMIRAGIALLVDFLL